MNWYLVAGFWVQLTKRRSYIKRRLWGKYLVAGIWFLGVPNQIPDTSNPILATSYGFGAS